MRILNNPQDAEDALQDTFVGCWKGIQQFDERAQFSSWIHRIAVNAAFRRLRKEFTNRTLLPLDEAVEIARNDEPTMDNTGLVWQAVANLPGELGEIFRLKYIHQLSSEEIGVELNLSSDNVRQRLHRARIALASKLQPILCPDGDVTCGGDLGLLLDLIDGNLLPSVSIPVRAHIDQCPGCAASEVGFLWLMTMVESPIDVPIPVHLVERLILNEIDLS